MAEAIDGALTQRRDSTRALVLASYRAQPPPSPHETQPDEIDSAAEHKITTTGQALSERSGDKGCNSIQHDFEMYLDHLKQMEEARKLQENQQKNEDLERLALYTPEKKPAKSTGLTALHGAQATPTTTFSSRLSGSESIKVQCVCVCVCVCLQTLMRIGCIERTLSFGNLQAAACINTTLEFQGTGDGSLEGSDASWIVHAMVYEVW